MKKYPNHTPTAKQEHSSSRESHNPLVTQDMAFYCFDVLIAKLNHLPPPQPSDFTNDPFAIFVTWKKIPELSLRGCIGTFVPLPLHEGLQQYTLESARRDSRFTPIQLNEIKHLQVTVSLLTHFENGNDYLDWIIGIHGIQIEFKQNGHSESSFATFLPEISTQQGWNQIETIDALLRKGGFKGDITSDIRSRIKLKRYQSEKISTNYEDYERIRREQNATVFKTE